MAKYVNKTLCKQNSRFSVRKPGGLPLIQVHVDPSRMGGGGGRGQVGTGGTAACACDLVSGRRACRGVGSVHPRPAGAGSLTDRQAEITLYEHPDVHHFQAMNIIIFCPNHSLKLPPLPNTVCPCGKRSKGRRPLGALECTQR